MEFTVTCKCEASSIEELAAKLSQIEGNRRSRSHVQSVVGPQDAAFDSGESGRWPDRRLLPKIRSFVLDSMIEEVGTLGGHAYDTGFNHCCEKIVKYLEALDKGS